MELYECILIFRKNIPEFVIDDKINAIFNDFLPNIARKEYIEKLGVKQLAYEIDEEKEANYVQVKFNCSPSVIPLFERNCRVEDAILKFIFIKEN